MVVRNTGIVNGFHGKGRDTGPKGMKEFCTQDFGNRKACWSVDFENIVEIC